MLTNYKNALFCFLEDTMIRTRKKELFHIRKAFKYSANGFKETFRSEVAFRLDVIFCSLFCIIAFILDIPLYQKAMLISSLLFIIIMELINTAIETIIDRISLDYHKMSKKAKDVGSLMVLVSFINAIIIWGLILYPKFF